MRFKGHVRVSDANGRGCATDRMRHDPSCLAGIHCSDFIGKIDGNTVLLVDAATLAADFTVPVEWKAAVEMLKAATEGRKATVGADTGYDSVGDAPMAARASPRPGNFPSTKYAQGRPTSASRWWIASLTGNKFPDAANRSDSRTNLRPADLQEKPASPPSRSAPPDETPR